MTPGEGATHPDRDPTGPGPGTSTGGGHELGAPAATAHLHGPRGPVREPVLLTLLASSIALAALGIDILLPAFPALRTELGLPADSTAVSGLITAYLLGLALGQLGFGPLSDRLGRRPALALGLALYLAGALAAALAVGLSWLLLARFVWGLGAAGPRVVVIAAARDVFVGDRLSRAMSSVMAVFMLVPIIAPVLGAGIVAVGSWRWVFLACALAATAVAVWAAGWFPETLAPSNRLPLDHRRLTAAAATVVRNRTTVGYGAALTCLWGAFLSYIGTSELLVGRTYGRPAAFPLVFGALAVGMAAAAVTNARIVERIGTRALTHRVLVGYLGTATWTVVLAAVTQGRPAVVIILPTLAVLLAAHALLVPNLTSLAMGPMGAVAGTASALLGAAQLAVGALLASVLDARYDGTVLPLSVGFLIAGVAALGLVLHAERGRLHLASRTD